MSDFNFIRQEVYTITKRPELVAQTELAIKSATLQLHRSDFFYKDLFETALQFDTLAYDQNIEYRALFPRYRALKYLRKFYPYSVGGETVGKFYDIKTPKETVGLYGEDLTDLCYVAGNLIQIKSSTPEEYALIGIYQAPVIATADTYVSWIADECPYAVVWAAAAIVQGQQKDIKGQQMSQQQAIVEFTETKNSNIIAEGY